MEKGWETLNRGEDGSLRGDDGKVDLSDGDDDHIWVSFPRTGKMVISCPIF